MSKIAQIQGMFEKPRHAFVKRDSGSG